MTVQKGDNISIRQSQIRNDIVQRYSEKIASLKKREDYSAGFEYFLDVLSYLACPQKLKDRFTRPLAAIYCAVAPLEVIDFFGFQPLQLYCGSYISQIQLSPFSPTFCCSIAKSCINAFYLEDSLDNLCDILILPTTCDWKTRVFEIARHKKNNFYLMDLPHVKDNDKGSKRWLAEVHHLTKRLEKRAGKKFKSKDFIFSINKYMAAWKEFTNLLILRRKGLLPAVWNFIITNAFMIDGVESWVDNVKKLTAGRSLSISGNASSEKLRIFLAGSPIFFPNLKILEAIEETGMYVAADNLCTSESLFGTIVYRDTSEYGLLKAVAERYQSFPQCPVFVADDNKLTNIINTMKEHGIKGVIYHVVKGCHPFDFESLYFEKAIKEHGLHFLKIETDQYQYDKESILTRLEAFKETLI